MIFGTIFEVPQPDLLEVLGDLHVRLLCIDLSIYLSLSLSIYIYMYTYIGVCVYIYIYI